MFQLSASQRRGWRSGLRQVERSGSMRVAVKLVGLLRWSPAQWQFDADISCGDGYVQLVSVARAH